MEEVKNMKSVNTPEAEFFSKVNPNATNLDSDKSDVFHTKIYKKLFLCQRELPNIQPTLPFLCTRVKGRYEED